MLYTTKKSFMLSLIVLLSINSISANSSINEDDAYDHQADKQGSWSGTEDCNSKLKIGELRATRIKAYCQEVNKLTALKLHSDHICANNLDVPGEARFNDIDARTLCTNVISTTSLGSDSVCANNLSVSQQACFSSLDAQEICVNDINASSIVGDAACANTVYVNQQLCADTACIDTLRANNACVDNLIANSFEQCGRFRATMTFSTNTTYTLGEVVEWNLILDDPNGDIVLSPDSAYIAPRSGYYTLFYQLDQFNLQGDSLVLGTPVSNLEIRVNGIPARQTYLPYLTFHNEQRATISGLISLKAGDVVTAIYNVLVMTDTGFENYDGTVDIIAAGTLENASLFKIHLISLDCTDLPCTSCSVTDCLQSCVDICEPCAPVDCVPECSPVGPKPCVCLPCPTPCCTACPTDCSFVRE